MKNREKIVNKGLYELEDGATVFYYPSYYSQSKSDQILEYLKHNIEWNQCVGKFGPVPRLNAWNSEVGLNYSYSGITHKGLGWNPVCKEILNRINNEFNYSMNSLLLNYYRNGGDSIGKHSDAEPPLGQNPVVISLSFGVSRRFKMFHQNKKIDNKYLSHSVVLNHGDLLIMAGTFQHTWHHELPKENNVNSERISLTFRRILI